MENGTATVRGELEVTGAGIGNSRRLSSRVWTSPSTQWRAPSRERQDLISIFKMLWLLWRRDGDHGESTGVWLQWKQVHPQGRRSAERMWS